MFFTLITGATGGLGREYALECAKRGYNLFLTATNNQRLEKLKDDILLVFPNIKIELSQCNLADEFDRNKLIKLIKDKGIKINRFIANAGIDFEGPVLEKETDELLKVIKINCEATIHLAHFVILQKPENEKLFLLIVSSLASYFSMPQKAIYASSKAMLTSFFIAMHEELKDKKINVTIVCPGGMPTTQEMINSIKSQGLSGKLSSTSAKVVAIKSLNKLEKNKATYIPGFFNRFLKFLSLPFTKLFIARQINNRWKKTRKKAKELGN